MWRENEGDLQCDARQGERVREKCECGGRGVWCCKTARVNAEQVRRMEKSNGGTKRRALRGGSHAVFVSRELPELEMPPAFYYVTIPATASIPTEPSTQLDVFLAITTASRCLHCVTRFSMHPQTPYSTSYQNISSTGKRIVAESRARTVHPLKFFPRCMNSPPPRFLTFVDSSV